MLTKRTAIAALTASLVAAVTNASAQECPVPSTSDTVLMTGYNSTTEHSWYTQQAGETVYIGATWEFSESVRENYEILEAYPLYDSTEIFDKPLSDVTFPFPTVNWAERAVAPTYVRFVGVEEDAIEAYSMGILFLNLEGFFEIEVTDSADMQLLTLGKVEEPSDGAAAACQAWLDEPMAEED
ncbi:hypothetical protein FF098_001210 [Parvularcula flava]|uniref:Uncharacterized protein n=1 Tax=Aquisalinus luteolus TaxID=1566827 RepID=A0A8J3A420_9PROT|nr:hypothetical protein [Aquisalinus luteolus]NHK26521.1 hypothetical protein [Aquisalinus luteolus]GGH92592.1 hypothetical protein GCM10011355_02450 [Aquisalinus luteolus]